jgi:hypothetical protein
MNSLGDIMGGEAPVGTYIKPTELSRMPPILTSIIVSWREKLLTVLR